MQNAFKE